MKKYSYFALATLIVVSMLAVALQTNSVATYAETDKRRSGRSQSKVQEEKVKSGPEVARRVIQLKQNSQAIRNALKVFDRTSKKTGHAPKIEGAWGIISRVSDKTLTRAITPNAPRFQKTAFHPQDTVSEYGVEIIFIPSYSVEGEWQGTLIANIYDSDGNFLRQYVADVVFRQDASFVWNGLFEVSFEGDQAYLQSDATLGMITDPNFEFGTPVDQQTYEPQPEWNPLLISMATRAVFWPANYRAGSTTPQRFPRPPGYPPNPRATKWAKCTIAWCAGTGGVGCGVLSLLTAGTAWGPCALAACSGSTAACAISAIID